MAEAVGPLEREMVERIRPVPLWTSLPAAGSTDSSKALRKSIPKMAIWTSACRKVHLKHWPDSFSCTSLSPQHMIGRPVGPTMPRPEAGRLEE
jgi:hypothetical protein